MVDSGERSPCLVPLHFVHTSAHMHVHETNGATICLLLFPGAGCPAMYGGSSKNKSQKEEPKITIETTVSSSAMHDNPMWRGVGLVGNRAKNRLKLEKFIRNLSDISKLQRRALEGKVRVHTSDPIGSRFVSKYAPSLTMARVPWPMEKMFCRRVAKTCPAPSLTDTMSKEPGCLRCVAFSLRYIPCTRTKKMNQN